MGERKREKNRTYGYTTKGRLSFSRSNWITVGNKHAMKLWKCICCPSHTCYLRVKVSHGSITSKTPQPHESHGVVFGDYAIQIRCQTQHVSLQPSRITVITMCGWLVWPGECERSAQYILSSDFNNHKDPIANCWRGNFQKLDLTIYD